MFATKLGDEALDERGCEQLNGGVNRQQTISSERKKLLRAQRVLGPFLDQRQQVAEQRQHMGTEGNQLDHFDHLSSPSLGLRLAMKMTARGSGSDLSH